jgi:uncharacterized protein YndB with AHSA1/START domain
VTERRVERRVTIAAPPRACFDALVDYGSMPEWQRAVRRCEVAARDERGRGREVDWEIDAKLRSVSYRLRYEYEEPHRIECRLVAGDLDDVEASYSLLPEGAGRTTVTLSLRVRPGVPVPGPLERMLNRLLLRGTLDDLKRRVEGG